MAAREALASECTEGIRLCQLVKSWLVHAGLPQFRQEGFAQIGEGFGRASAGQGGVVPATIMAEQQVIAESGVQNTLDVLKEVIVIDVITTNRVILNPRP